jgi:formylglycine-generating enzyme required for sulfatase activity
MENNMITETINDISFQMILVEGGTFMMGCTAEQGEDCFEWEKPAHEVNLKSYYIGETQVTQELWQAVMGNNPSHYRGEDSLPVEQVSWNEVQDFLSKLSSITGKNYRLPTEAEWEFAARGGNMSKGYKYAGSDSLDEITHYSDSPKPVAQKKSNELGIYDMSGNIWEWCADEWHLSYEGALEDGSAWVDGTFINRVLRGGLWWRTTRDARVSSRVNGNPANGYYSFGFRLAL